ncbi:MAG: substrate-binding domain-containing protein [Lachnospiraceae bacterium]|nr:substrate-binding domain-containing protein [Lachnospiraceae bacterium]
MKKVVCILVFLIAFSFLLTGCSKKQETKSESIETETSVATVKKPEEMVYAIVTKSEGNRYNELEAEGYQKVIEEFGATCIVAHPKSTTAMEQVRLIEKLIEEDVDAITVAANDADALDDVLKKAQEEGILITTVDSNVNPDYTSLFINQVDTKTLAQTLLDAVYDISGGSGQWAILSASSMAPNQTAWIKQMKDLMKEDEKYKKLDLVEIAYGDDLDQLSKNQATAILQTYQDLKVICAPTTVGCRAAAEVVADTETKCLVTGLGLPSEMDDYIADEGPCPYMYIWDSEQVGELAAYATLALMKDELVGMEGHSFTAGDLGKFTVQENEDGGAEIVAGMLLRINKNNIDHWKNVM